MPAITLVSALADSTRRRAAAKELARYLGADDVIVFVKDAEVGAQRPAIGFPQTLPGDRAWQKFIEQCSKTQELEQAELPYPDASRIRGATGLACSAECVLVLLGGAPHPNRLEEIRTAMPLLAAVFAAERKAAAGEEHAIAARAATERAKALAASLAAFTEKERGLAEQVAQHAAVAMSNARLIEAEQQARAHAEMASQQREDLLAAVSHDLKNPLSSIVTATALLQRMAASGEAPNRTQKYVAMISRAAGNMNRMIGDLLDLASMESGNFVVSCAPREVAPLLEECFDMLSPVATSRSLRLQGATDGRGIWVHCDVPRVGQILSNLVGNAIKFTPQGGSIRVDVETIGDEARFSISDTGPGIPEEQLSHIFDRYWRARQERRTGIGLGLSIAKGLVEAHGGRIWVESRVDKGTTFFFTLRAAQASIAQREPSAPDEAERPRKRRLLVIDDDRELRESLCEFLEESGYDVVDAKDPIEAFEQLRKTDRPDLILVDPMMPGMNDGQFREVQMRDAEFATIPLLIMTSSRDLKAPTNADAVVYKPLRLDQLLRTIEQQCVAAKTSSGELS